MVVVVESELAGVLERTRKREKERERVGGSKGH